MLSRHYWWPRMRKDVAQWCKSCLACATRHVGRVLKPLLTPIPVEGPFDRIGVDVVELPVSKKGHKYAAAFMDYLTKWPEAFSTKDQTAPTIANCSWKRSSAAIDHQLHCCQTEGPVSYPDLYKTYTQS